MNTVDRGIAIAQLALIGGVAFGAYLLYKEFTSDTGLGSTDQNGHRYSLAAQLFGGPTHDGSNQIFDTTGDAGDGVSALSEEAAANNGQTAYDRQLLATPGFIPGVPGTADKLHGG